MALKGEMAELKNLKDNYPKVFETILLLSQRIETFKKQQAALQ
jgi:lysozyme family protein